MTHMAIGAQWTSGFVFNASNCTTNDLYKKFWTCKSIPDIRICIMYARSENDRGLCILNFHTMHVEVH